MAVSEPRRIALHRAAADSWGEEAADTMMELVTPPGEEPATRSDIQTLAHLLDAMEQRLQQQITHLREHTDAQIEALSSRLDAQFAQHAAHVDAQFAAHREHGDAQRAQHAAHLDAQLAAHREHGDAQLAAHREHGDVQRAQLAAHMDAQLAAHREHTDAQFSQHREHMDTQFSGLRQYVDDRFEVFGNEWKAHLEERLNDVVVSQTRTLVFSQLATLVVLVGLIIGLD